MPTYHQLTVQEYLNRETQQQGVCLKCASWTGRVDPAAARLRCGVCGEPGVHGIDQALLLGFIQIQC
jgi:hypothetical protein